MLEQARGLKLATICCQQTNDHIVRISLPPLRTGFYKYAALDNPVAYHIRLIHASYRVFDWQGNAYL